ncbi:glycine cleavage system aminomethyltransferase GcvT [Pseudooceanicola sp.]|uniref:glycine cleavage system aminomethyltransferase GcvT n=1 Tax=Pseudooceanicola sp. TaxID=1914328 RepID=UPI00262DD973|nr:glycine cleavage system aminomethyltransferase GcvT [Pseudooceanicola sp.]MDF1855974.1 glycine cleavage system aminomethyltransferase GcvT [Pseudooceanicola sp.]
MTGLLKTPLHGLHLELGARMVAFAGYDMPVQYAPGVMKEHIHCRDAAGLFDVSHMGQVILRGDNYPAIAHALEALIPVNIADLAPGRQRYGFFTNDAGGILDDLMLANRGDHLFLVVNAACKQADLAHLRAHLSGIEITEVTDRALVALQGPQAEAALARLAPAVAQMRFMDVLTLDILGADCWVSRSGYTGEDGFEISVPADRAEALVRALLVDERVLPIGLGARDSLRLEAGLCLYGHDMDAEVSPVEAGLAWAIQKVRRSGGDRAGGFPGAGRILSELDAGASRLRVGLLPEGRAPMREGTPLFADAEAAEPIGAVTSGAFGPTLGAPMSMGYLPVDLATPGTEILGEVRGKRLPARVATLPFVPARFKR